MSDNFAADTIGDPEPEVELNDYGQPKRSPCPQPKFSFDEYVAECGPCGPDTPHGALWRELATAAIKPQVALASFSTPSSPEAAAAGEPRVMKPMFGDSPRLSDERDSKDSAILGKCMAVMLVVPEKRDAAVAEVQRLIAGEDLTEAADWAFYEVGLFSFYTFGHAGWWHPATAHDLAMYRTGSEHIIKEVESSFKGCQLLRIW